MPEVTVVCGFYNRPHLVKRTLNGLAGQTFADAEFLVFDDGSTDRTANEVHSYVEASGDRRFRFVAHSQNMGLTRGLVDAIRLTDSRYVAIQDAGDFSLPFRLVRQVSALQDVPDRVVVGSYYANYVETTGVCRIRRPGADNATLASLVVDPTFTHGEVTFRRSAYDRVGGYRTEFLYSQDNDLWLRMITQGRFHTVPEVLYVRALLFSGISYQSESFARQSCYYILGKRLALDTAPPHALERLSAGEDIFAVIPKDDPAVQRVLVRGCFRAMYFGSPETATAIATRHLTSRSVRAAILGLTQLSELGPARAAMELIWRVVGQKHILPEVQQMIDSSR